MAERCDAGGTGGARGKCGGDGPVRAARKALTGGSRRHRGWSVRRLAPWRVHGRRPVAPPATRGCWEVESEARGAAGRLGREGVLFSGVQKRAAPTATSMPILAWSRPCQCRHRHRSLTSGLQKRCGSRHSAPNFKTYQIAEQTFCKFGSWSDQNFENKVLAKKGKSNLGKQNIFVLARIFPGGVGMPCAGV